jgi:hypothetical protein
MRKEEDWSLPLVEDIRRALAGCGLGVNELGRRTGVDPGQLSRFMTGKRVLNLSAAGRVCQALGLRLAQDGPAPVPEDKPEGEPARRPRKATGGGEGRAGRKGKGKAKEA